jgi:hypothetical protein
MENKLGGSLVRRVKIGSKCLHIENFSKLPENFPRVEELVCKIELTKQQEDNCSMDLSCFKVWETSLKKLELRSMISLLPALFLNLCFSKLTSICLKWPVKVNGNQVPDTLINSLANLPSLDSLYICFLKFSSRRLELLHQNTPHLVNLTIVANILAERSIEFSNRRDATQFLPKIKSFRLIGDYSNFRVATELLVYFTLKYCALENFTMIKKDMKTERFMTGINLEDMQHFDTARETLINTLPLKTFGMNNHATNERLWNLISQKKIRVTNLGVSYISLNSLTTVFNSEYDIKYLKTLIISHFDGDALLDFPFMPSLKRLGIRKCHRSKKVPINSVLQNSPKLHYLFLYDCVAQMEFSPIPSSLESSLKTLSLDHISLECSSFDYISKHCPLLENLHLDNVNFIAPGALEAHAFLPGHHLKELFILMPYGINGCTIKTQAKQHRFCAEFSDQLDFYLFQRSSMGREAFHIIDLDQQHSEHLPPRFDNLVMYLTLECKSVELFKLNYEWITL